MQILKLVDTEGNPLGVISWFAVHCTSMNNTNRLISGDNKGYASYLFEQHMNPNSLPGKVSNDRYTIHIYINIHIYTYIYGIYIYLYVYICIYYIYDVYDEDDIYDTPFHRVHSLPLL